MRDVKELLEVLKKSGKITLIMVLINIAYFIFLEVIGNTEDGGFMYQYGAMYGNVIESGEYYRLITSMFMHFGLPHLANNMIILFVLGNMLESITGSGRFFIIYMLSGIGGNLFSMFWDMRTLDYAISAGASGAVFGVMGGLLAVFLKNWGKMSKLSTKRFIIMVALSLYLGVVSTGVDYAAHVGGFIAGFVLTVLIYFPKKEKSSCVE